MSPALLMRIAEAIQGVRYGTIQITVHDARVVQIDKLERVRIVPTAHPPDPPAPQAGTWGSAPPPSPTHRISGGARPESGR